MIPPTLNVTSDVSFQPTTVFPVFYHLVFDRRRTINIENVRSNISYRLNWTLEFTRTLWLWLWLAKSLAMKYTKREKKKKRKNTTRRKKEKRNYVSKKWLSVYLRNCMWYVEVDTWTVDKSNYILINDEADRDMDASVNGYGGKSFLKTFSSFHLAISPLIRTCTRRLLIKIFITLATES